MDLPRESWVFYHQSNALQFGTNDWQVYISSCASWSASVCVVWTTSVDMMANWTELKNKLQFHV